MGVIHNWAIFCYASILHLVWAGLLLFSDAPLSTTPIHGLTQWFGTSVSTSLILIIVSLLALVGMGSGKRDWRHMLLLSGQQIIMLLSMFGAMECIARGSYADGVVRSRLFLTADQFPAILAGGLHTLALLAWFMPGLTARRE